jgi:phage terminase large subunit
MQFRILDYYSATGEHISHFIRELQNRGYTYDTIWLPHDARAKHLGSRRTIEETVRNAGYRVEITPNISKTDGVNAARMIFPNCWFDEEKCDEGLQSLRHYRYRIVDGQYSNEPLHDWASDAADAFRYLAVCLRERRVGIAEAVVNKLAAITDNIRRRREQDLEFSGRSHSVGDGSGHGWMR